VCEVDHGGIPVASVGGGLGSGAPAGSSAVGSILGGTAMTATSPIGPDPAGGMAAQPGGGPAGPGVHCTSEDLAARGTFDSLLRSLLSWELVTQCVDGGEGEDGEWRLSEIAQRRLSELQPAVPRLDERTVYFGHACVDCRQRRPTRLMDGVYRCETCAERRRVTVANGVPANADAREATRRGQSRGGLWEWRLHRHHPEPGSATGGLGDQRTSA